MSANQPLTTDEESIDDLDELNEVIPSNFSITSYGADYPVDGLVKRMKQKDIVVPLFSLEPEQGQSTVGFQREYVWTKPQADRFIESLLLGLPVPGIFLVKESNGKHLVLDGQQRLKTLESFYSGAFQSKVYELENVQERWQGKTYETLHADDRRRLDDSIIHAIVIRQDEPTEDQSSVYLIFERLNSGGTFLQPQEIRVALYHGQLATVLSRLNNDENWRAMYGKRSSRLKDQELILRFFALYYHSQSYARPMKAFLNRYMASNRTLSKHSESDLTKLFQSATKTTRDHIGARAFRLRNAVNAAILDSVLVGVADRLLRGTIDNPDALKHAYDALLQDTEYLAATTRATADEESVKTRIRLAKQAFKDVK